jgi:hypothetical protein
MKIKPHKKGAASDCVSQPAPGIHSDSPHSLTHDQAIPYSQAKTGRREWLALAGAGIICSIIGGVSIFHINVSVFSNEHRENGSDPTEKFAELTFPPPKSKVPQTVYLKGNTRNIDEKEDLRVEVRNHKGQHWYKKMKFKPNGEIYRDDHHFGLVGKDIGRKFYVQLVIPMVPLHEGDYGEAQPVKRIGRQTYYIRRAGALTEKLSPETWRQEMIDKGEIAPART